jgi:protein-disulfide isomerase
MNRKLRSIVAAALMAMFGWAVLAQAAAGEIVVAGDVELERQPMLGSLDAPVELLMFEDFNCPVCRAFILEALPRLKSEYIDQGQLRAQFINIAFFGADSTTAALAGECAFHQDEVAFWDYRNAIYRAQGSQGEGQRWATPALLVELAGEHAPGLDTAELGACIDESRYEVQVQRNHDIAKALGIAVTPVILVNGTQVASPSYEDVSAAIEQALP